MNDKLKEKIRELEQKYHYVADNLIDAIWVINAETLKFEYITPSIENLSGYRAEEYMGLSVEERMTPDSFRKTMHILMKERERFEKGSGAVRKFELEMIHKNGTLYWTEQKAKFVKENNTPVKIVGIVRDITEQKKEAEKQNELIQKLGEALAEKETLLKEIKVLRGLLPICSGCKRIRDDQGRWWPLDAYVTSQTDSKLTHTICHDCKDIYYGDV